MLNRTLRIDRGVLLHNNKNTEEILPEAGYLREYIRIYSLF